MNHAITIGGLLCSVGAIGGLLLMAFGALSAFGNMMADTAGDNGKQGCTCLVVGLAVMIASLVGLFA